MSRPIPEKQKPWHEVLPVIIDRIRLDAVTGAEQLRIVMMQFQIGNVPTNHDLVERKCRDKAKAIGGGLEKEAWFRRSLQGLHRSKRQAAAKAAEAHRADNQRHDISAELHDGGTASPSYQPPNAAPLPPGTGNSTVQGPPAAEQ